MTFLSRHHFSLWNKESCISFDLYSILFYCIIQSPSKRSITEEHGLIGNGLTWPCYTCFQNTSHPSYTQGGWCIFQQTPGGSLWRKWCVDEFAHQILAITSKWQGGDDLSMTDEALLAVTAGETSCTTHLSFMCHYSVAATNKTTQVEIRGQKSCGNGSCWWMPCVISCKDTVGFVGGNTQEETYWKRGVFKCSAVYCSICTCMSNRGLV